MSLRLRGAGGARGAAETARRCSRKTSRRNSRGKSKSSSSSRMSKISSVLEGGGRDRADRLLELVRRLDDAALREGRGPGARAQTKGAGF